ncbi:transglycosylase domain-containing protein [Promicromonospora thailandica]|uniref:Membrane carboxypeptidase (Penicillin-binding protein) n=1 Tax=Promicromonospora thailandica TaxID=765201 RepID=A0A9X2GB34_9MICO|nr:transglycosylase domain-containing protein [Promicromonospora thailandica]MCP2266409.1 Membrane carboxypeptidase (penicillin-binding protein) [Promicromonospora thailandica]BFF20089.1 transglycosylase domain-containing protein [Promicromonospora thailandica]
MAMANPREPRRITRTIPAAQLIGLLLAFVLTAGAGGVIAAGLVIPLASGVDTAVDTGVEVFNEVPDELVPGPLSEQSVIYASDNKTKLATFYAQNRIVVPLDKVADTMKHAVIAIEDERFYAHGGVDPEGISRAAVKNFGGGDMQGASTLTQQYVKNVLIEEAVRSDDTFGALEAAESSLTRKLREAKLAIALEKEMSKDEILQGYLNIAQFGRSVYGVETAARYYFNKSSSKLSVVEAATIAGITKSPSAFDPVANPEEAEVRRNLVIGKMWQLGYITTAERDEAMATKLADTLNVQPLEVGCDAAKGAAFFCDYVIKEVMASPEFGKTRDDRYDLLYRGGLRIVTTLDMKMQRAAEKTVAEGVPSDNPYGLEAAVTSVVPGTGEIRAMAQNRPYDATSNPAAGTTAQNYSADYNHGNSRGFQVGSNFKPYVLAEWLRSGHQLYDSVSAGSYAPYETEFTANGCVHAFTHQPWPVRNVEGSTSGNVSVLQGTFQSLNTVYARMSQQIDLCNLQKTAWDVGFRPMTSAMTYEAERTFRTIDEPQQKDIDVVASMTLGTQASTPLNQAAAYATFASGGTYCEPVAILEVKDHEGKKMKVPGANCKQTLEPNVANTVAFAMTKVFSTSPWGTAWSIAPGLADGRPVAGKTGTTNGATQSWFTGYTPELSTSVWVGEASGETNHMNVILPSTGWYNASPKVGPLFGGTAAAPTWRRYMDQAMVGLPETAFPAPDPNLVGKKPAPPKVEKPDSGDNDGGGDSGDGGGEGGGPGGGGPGGGRGGDD